jgi:hypothetical protein
MVSVALASAIAVGTLMIITILVTLITGSVFAAGVVVALIAIAYTVLVYYGFLNVKISNNNVEVSVWDVIETPIPSKSSLPAIIKGKEVYRVGDDQFNYDDAPAVCAAYGAELATQDQVESAFSSGAEWCGYGWTAGGVALFPTQRATWDLLQKEVDPKKRTACGRPGVNGGYFDPTLKFGVNCYGVKPDGIALFPSPLPGTDMKAFNERVASFKARMKDFFLDPFNRMSWSSSYGSQFAQNIGGLADSVGGSMPPPSAVSAGTSVGVPAISASSANAPVWSPAGTAAPVGSDIQGGGAAMPPPAPVSMMPPPTTVSAGTTVGVPAASSSSVNTPVGSPAGSAAPVGTDKQSVIAALTAFWQSKIADGCYKIEPTPSDYRNMKVGTMPIDNGRVLVPTDMACKLDQNSPAMAAVMAYGKANPMSPQESYTQIMQPALKALV